MILLKKLVNAQITVLNDLPEYSQLGVQDPATSNMEGMIYFHNYISFFIIFIGVFVFYILSVVISSYSKKKTAYNNFTHSSELEIGWTILPAVLLLFLAIPSFSLLYTTEEILNPVITLKVVGHQWYWSYEISDFDANNASINFDSYMIPSNDLTTGAPRLLEVDNRLGLPIHCFIRVLVTSADVLHSWAIPSFGFKLDACAGRLSAGGFTIDREGTFYAQCSEICGVNHGFMPIVIRSLLDSQFITYISTLKE